MADLTFEQISTPATQPQWLQTLYAGAVLLGLPTTSWRDGDPERVFLELSSYINQRFDALASAYNQGGFIDTAATGTVTFEFPDGTSVTFPISPDPSDLSVNPNGDITLLDQLLSQNYFTNRIRQTTAGGTLAVLNVGASTYGPFVAGTYHVSNPTTKATYSNTASLSIPPSTIAGTSVSTAVSSGGLIKITTSTNHGLATDDVVFITGVLGTTEANGAWLVTVVDADEFTLQGSVFVSAYTSGGTVYEPTVTTVTADVAGSASGSFDGAGALALHTVTDAITALIDVSVSNPVTYVGTDTESNIAYAARGKLRLQSVTTNGARGAYEFYALSSITYAPLIVPPFSVSTPITKVRVVESLADGKVYVFVANASGPPSTADTNATSAVLQIWPRPASKTVVTQKATAVNVAVVINVYLRSSFATTANQAILVSAVQAYFQTLPLGGFSDPALAYTNVLPINDLIGLVYEIAKPRSWTVDNVTATLNGVNANVSLPISTSLASVAVLSPATPTINMIPT
jgi:hypothetical protein